MAQFNSVSETHRRDRKKEVREQSIHMACSEITEADSERFTVDGSWHNPSLLLRSSNSTGGGS